MRGEPARFVYLVREELSALWRIRMVYACNVQSSHGRIR